MSEEDLLNELRALAMKMLDAKVEEAFQSVGMIAYECVVTDHHSNNVSSWFLRQINGHLDIYYGSTNDPDHLLVTMHANTAFRSKLYSFKSCCQLATVLRKRLVLEMLSDV